MRGLSFRLWKEVEAPPGGAKVRAPFSVVEQLSQCAQTPLGPSLRCAFVHTWGRRAGRFSHGAALHRVTKVDIVDLTTFILCCGLARPSQLVILVTDNNVLPC